MAYGWNEPAYGWGYYGLADAVLPRGGTPQAAPQGGDGYGGASEGGAVTDANREATAGVLARHATASLPGAASATLGGLLGGAPAAEIGKSVLGGVLSPSSIAGLGGSLVNASLGINNFGNSLAGLVGGAALGPVGALAGGLLGGLGVDMVKDTFNPVARKESYKGQYGPIQGRMAYKDYNNALNALSAGIDDYSERMSIPRSLEAMRLAEQAIADAYGNRRGWKTAAESAEAERMSGYNDALSRGWTGLAPGGFDPFGNMRAPIGVDMGGGGNGGGSQGYGGGNVGGNAGGNQQGGKDSSGEGWGGR